MKQTLLEQVNDQIGHLVNEKDEWHQLTLNLGGKPTVAEVMFVKRGNPKVRTLVGDKVSYFYFNMDGELVKMGNTASQKYEQIDHQDWVLRRERHMEKWGKQCWCCDRWVDTMTEAINVDDDHFVYCMEDKCQKAWLKVMHPDQVQDEEEVEEKVTPSLPTSSSIKRTKPCPRCNGGCYLSRYAHVQNGVCFKCQGRGVVDA